MAINPETQYPGKINPSDSDYPFGSARNITTPGDGTGTPWEAAFVNDLMGFFQAALVATNQVPSGTPEKSNVSQIFLGLNAVVDTVADIAAASPQIGQAILTRGNQSPGDGGSAFYRVIDSASFTGDPDGVTQIVTATGDIAVFTPVGGSVRTEQINGTATVVINVATTGTDTGRTGLKASEPLATGQAASDFLESLNSRLVGEWVIDLAAGSYSRIRFPENGLQSSLPIVVRGPDVGGHPNIPTALITDGASVSAEGVRARNGTNVMLKDVKVIGYQGNVSSIGFSGGNRCNLYTDNAHFEDCQYGVSNSEWGLVDVKGGIFDTCGYVGGAVANGAAIRGLFGTKFSVGTQNAGSLTNGPIIRNCYFAANCQEGVTGHFDWVTCEDNDNGVRLRVVSRLNMDGASFKRHSGAAIWADDNSVVSISSDTEFGTGADANGNNFIANNGAVLPIDEMTTTTHQKASTERCIQRDIIDQAISTTSPTIIHRITLEAQKWVSAASSPFNQRAIRFKLYGELQGTNDIKRLQMRFGGVQNIITFTAAETGDFECEGLLIIGDNPTNVHFQKITGFRFGGTGTRVSINSATVDLTANAVFDIEALVGNVADTVLVNAYEVWVDGI